MKTCMTCALVLLLALPLAAQLNLPKPDLNPFHSSGSGLLGINHLSMSHSIGFSAGVSSNGKGYYLSRYTNHLRYEFNPKLNLELDLNVVNFGTASSSFKINSDNKSKILPEFKLTYKPSENVSLQLEFRQGNPWLTEQTTPWYERW
jgi:hypothetical protein